jgi:glycosyltransferase involved in cell wall biosynthesis
MSPLRIGYYLASYPGGGIATHLLALIDHLRGKHDIRLFYDSSDGRQPFSEELNARGLDARSIRPPAIATTGILKPAAASLPVIFAVRSALARERLDVIHFHAGRLGVLYAPILASRLAGIPARILTVHNSVEKRSRVHRFIEGGVLGCLDRIIAVTDQVKAELIGKKNAAAEKVAVISNGVDVAEFMESANPSEARRALGLPDNAAVVGMVGRVSYLKGADLLIRAAASIKSRFPRLRIVLIGAGREEREFRKLAEEQAVSDIVLFAGYRSDARCLMRGFDLLALPSRREAQPFTILEAMASAKPVVAARVGGIPGIVVDGVTGLLFPSENVAALADALGRLLDDPKKREAMGAAGRERVEKYFSQAAMVERTLAHYGNPTA